MPKYLNKLTYYAFKKYCQRESKNYLGEKKKHLTFCLALKQVIFEDKNRSFLHSQFLFL